MRDTLGDGMSDIHRQVLVLGATGQQGGSAAAALLEAGWAVRALVRDPDSAKAAALRDTGVELVRGSFDDLKSMRRAMLDVHGVFSIQPSSGGGPVLGITDEQEERYGMAVAELAVECGAAHLVYTSTNAVGRTPTGMGHLDTKARIEAHIRTLPITSTIVRPATFMEMLVMPGFGLDQRRFDFFLRPEQQLQLIAVADIGRFVAAAFSDASALGGKTFEIAGDTVTGLDIQRLFTAAAGYPIRYARFSDELLAGNPFLRRLTELLDEGRLTGSADLTVLRGINPALQDLESWLAGPGRTAFRAALNADVPIGN